MTKLTDFKPMQDELLQLCKENKKLRDKLKKIKRIALPPDVETQGQKLDKIWDICNDTLNDMGKHNDTD